MDPDAIRPARPDDTPAILAVINAAAQRYKGAIPHDCWHEPYMPAEDLAQQLAEGVVFSVLEVEGEIAGVMGLQRVGDVDLIRHAYVLPSRQGRGIGGLLLATLRRRALPRLLIGTWADAVWAIGFYEKHGFALATPARAQALLSRYWRIPPRQAEVSVVLEGQGGLATP